MNAAVNAPADNTIPNLDPQLLGPEDCIRIDRNNISIQDAGILAEETGKQIDA